MTSVHPFLKYSLKRAVKRRRAASTCRRRFAVYDDQEPTGNPASATMTPMSPAASRPMTTLRRRPIIHTEAARRTTTCQRWLMLSARGMAGPAIAPIAAGPAPVRKLYTPRPWHSWSKWRAPTSTKTNDGANATTEATRAPSTCSARH